MLVSCFMFSILCCISGVSRQSEGLLFDRLHVVMSLVKILKHTLLGVCVRVLPVPDVTHKSLESHREGQ